MTDGMMEQPIHFQVFGTDPARRKKGIRLLYGIALKRVMSKGILLCAEMDGSVVAVAGMMPPNSCQSKFSDRIRILPKILWELKFEEISRLRHWISEWRKFDLGEPHWHLGPISVDKKLQGKGLIGVGRALMKEACLRLDNYNGVGFGEVDRWEIVELYRRKYNAEIIKEVDVLGTPTWFMLRRPQPSNQISSEVSLKE